MYYNPHNLKNAKEMRSNMTPAETKMWRILRGKRFQNLKFKRQVLIGNYIVDFLCEDKKIIIEIDGGQHNEELNIQSDKNRTRYLENNGYKVLRFWNNEVMKNIDGVMEVIFREVEGERVFLKLKKKGQHAKQTTRSKRRRHSGKVFNKARL